MVVSKEQVEKEYPLHTLVWENNAEGLAKVLEDQSFQGADQLEKLDPRGRTPLLLAIILGHAEVAEVLLMNNASAQFEHRSGWNVLHEAICGGNPELVKLVLEYKDAQKQNKRSKMIPDLLRMLADQPDFYVEIKFELASWMPFVGNMMPGNVHRVYKMGSKLRVDSCIIDDSGVPDWDNAVSLIFQGEGDSVKMVEIYHAAAAGYSSVILCGKQDKVVVPGVRGYDRLVTQRMSRPAMIAYVDLDKIEFERNRTVWGWGSDKTETINGYECKVFSASNVEFITRLRTEHLSEAQKNQAQNKAAGAGGTNALQSFLQSFGTTETKEVTQGASAALLGATSLNYDEIPLEQYFDVEMDLKGRDIGKSKEIHTRVNKFKAQVWLSETYPLSLQVINPIIDIMALSNTMFSKLKQFIQMQLPAGFPVKIEIPLFHVINARVTFHNIFGTESNVRGVTRIIEDDERLSCVLDPVIFEPPSHYYIRSMSANSVGPINGAEDDDLFSWTLPDEEGQFQIQNPEQGKMVDIYEALNAPRSLTRDSPNTTSDSDTEEQLLQRAIEESLLSARMHENPDWRPTTSIDFGSSPSPISVPTLSVCERVPNQCSEAQRSQSWEDLQAALDLSRQEVEEDNRLRKEEEEAVKKILELSLLDK